MRYLISQTEKQSIARDSPDIKEIIQRNVSTQQARTIHTASQDNRRMIKIKIESARYITRERERATRTKYIYIYIERERERGRVR